MITSLQQLKEEVKNIEWTSDEKTAVIRVIDDICTLIYQQIYELTYED